MKIITNYYLPFSLRSQGVLQQLKHNINIKTQLFHNIKNSLRLLRII